VVADEEKQTLVSQDINISGKTEWPASSVGQNRFSVKAFVRMLAFVLG